MNKLFIGLLIIAAGTGAFLLLRKKSTQAAGISNENILGKWQMATRDSSVIPYRYEFQREGNILRSLNDTTLADTMHYEWNNASELVWKSSKQDSTSSVYKVIQLTKDTLQLAGRDSVVTTFLRAK